MKRREIAIREEYFLICTRNFATHIRSTNIRSFEKLDIEKPSHPLIHGIQRAM